MVSGDGGHQNPCLYPVRSGWVSHNGYQLVQEELQLATLVSHHCYLTRVLKQCPPRFRGLTLSTGQFLHKPKRLVRIQHVPPCLGRRERETTSEGLQDCSHHQRSCQGKDPGQGPESQSQRQSACGALRLSVNFSLEKPECLLHPVNESKRWQSPVQIATVGHLTLVKGRFSVTTTRENTSP